MKEEAAKLKEKPYHLRYSFHASKVIIIILSW